MSKSCHAGGKRKAPSTGRCGSTNWTDPLEDQRRHNQDVPPPRGSRFGSPLRLSRVHWVRPELVAEVKFLTWTDDNLLRQVVYEGLREDKPAAEVCRSPPYPKQ